MQEEKWHYMDGDKSFGPHSEEHIVSLVEKKELPATALVWSKGSQEWKPANQVFDLEGLFPPPLPGTKINPIKLPAINEKILKSTWEHSPPRPWRRYFARMLDTIISGSATFFIIGIVLFAIAPSLADNLFSSFEEPSGRVLDIIMTTLVAIFLNAAFIGFTGSSIGKFFFGIRVTDQNSKAIGYKLALKREFLVWIRGIGLGIPLISMITAIVGYQTLTREGKTSWDDELELNISYRSNSIQHYVMCILGLTVLFIAIAILRSI